MLDVMGTDDPEMLMGCLSPVVAWELENVEQDKVMRLPISKVEHKGVNVP
jgi:hypothetical protein